MLCVWLHGCLCGALWSCLVGELCVGDIKEVGGPEAIHWRFGLEEGFEFKASIACDLPCCPIHL